MGKKNTMWLPHTQCWQHTAFNSKHQTDNGSRCQRLCCQHDPKAWQAPTATTIPQESIIHIVNGCTVAEHTPADVVISAVGLRQLTVKSPSV
jgi:hypothetical protein